MVGTGTLTIAVGGASTSINIDTTDNTLAGIASAINSANNNPGVTASIITTTAGARLVLAGTATGAANAITVTESGGDGGLSSLVYDPANNVTNLTQTQAAQDASFSINGFARHQRQQRREQRHHRRHRQSVAGIGCEYADDADDQSGHHRCTELDRRLRHGA